MSSSQLTSHTVPPTMAQARDLRGFWRVLFAVVAPIAPIAAMVADIVQTWKYNASPAGTVAQIAANPGPETSVIWLHVVSTGLFIVGVIAVCWVTRRRAPLLTAIGGVLSGIGILMQAQLPNIDLITVVGLDKGIGHGALVALLTGLNAHPIATLGILAFLAHVVGQILIGIAIWRSRVAPWWLGLALILSGPLQMVGGATASVPIAAAGWLLNAAGFAAATIALLQTSNDDFDLPPTPVR